MSASSAYWRRRKSSLYLHAVRQLVEGLGADADSLLDVGSSGCPYLDWYDWIPRRTSLDLSEPYVSKHIESVCADFMLWQPKHTYDICTCLQVLEHIERADLFARKLLDTAKVLVVSVPYKWKFKASNSHIHDPIDEAKMRRWFKRDPHFSVVIQEVTTGARRMINVYEQVDRKFWKSLRRRS